MSAANSVPAVEYRPVDGFPGYRVGDDGSVWSFKAGRWKRLKVFYDTNGYSRIQLYRDGVGKQMAVHRLVKLTFHGPCPDGMEAAHENGNSRDPRLSNLTWKTRKDNSHDRFRHGTMLEGERAPTSKISNQQAADVAELLRQGNLTCGEIAKTTGVSFNTVRAICSGNGWRCVNDGKPIQRRPIRVCKLNDAQALEMRQLAAAGHTCLQLAKRFGVSQPAAHYLLRGLTWKHVGGPLLTGKQRVGRPPKVA